MCYEIKIAAFTELNYCPPSDSVADFGSNTVERQSADLACRRFTGTFSYDRVAELLSRVCTDFSPPTARLTGTVTDNATSFEKAFKEYGAITSMRQVL